MRRREPNIQTLTPRTPEARVIREAVSREFELMTVDYSDIEFRIMAWTVTNEEQ